MTRNLNLKRLLRQRLFVYWPTRMIHNRVAMHQFIAFCMISIFWCSFVLVDTSAQQQRTATTKFMNVGIEGISYNGVYRNLAAEKNTGLASVIMTNIPNGGGMNVMMITSQPRTLGQPQVIEDSVARVTAEDGSQKAVKWYSQQYEFEFMTYTMATTAIMPTTTYSTTMPWFNLYISSTTTDPGWARYDMTHQYSMTLSGQVLTVNPYNEIAKYRTTYEARVGLAIGNSINFPGEIVVQDGKYILNNTAYYIDEPIMLGNGQQSGFLGNQGIPRNMLRQLPTNTETKEKIENSAQNVDYTPADGGQDFKTYKMNAKNDFTTTTEVVKSTETFLQSIQQTDIILSMTEADTSLLKGSFHSDTSILPEPNEFCYINIPVDMQPQFQWKEYQAKYTRHDVYCRIPWHKRGFDLKAQMATSVTDSTIFVSQKSVQNPYYLQTIRFDVKFATLYNWQPTVQNSTTLVPPIEQRVEPEMPPTVSGEEEVAIEVVKPPPLLDFGSWFNTLFGSIFGKVALIGAIVVFGFLLFYTLSMRSKLTNAQWMMNQSMGMMNMGQPNYYNSMAEAMMQYQMGNRPKGPMIFPTAPSPNTGFPASPQMAPQPPSNGSGVSPSNPIPNGPIPSNSPQYTMMMITEPKLQLSQRNIIFIIMIAGILLIGASALIGYIFSK